MSNTAMPESIQLYEVFRDDGALVGSAEVQIPSFDSTTVTVKGAGIAGEDEVPVKGLFGAMTMTINWRVITEGQVELMVADTHSLNLYAPVQEYDSATGGVHDRQLHIYVKGRTKKSDPGKVTTGEASDASTELSVNYIKISKDGKELVECDKYNSI